MAWRSATSVSCPKQAWAFDGRLLQREDMAAADRAQTHEGHTEPRPGGWRCCSRSRRPPGLRAAAPVGHRHVAVFSVVAVAIGGLTLWRHLAPARRADRRQPRCAPAAGQRRQAPGGRIPGPPPDRPLIPNGCARAALRAVPPDRARRLAAGRCGGGTMIPGGRSPVGSLSRRVPTRARREVHLRVGRSRRAQAEATGDTRGP